MTLTERAELAVTRAEIALLNADYHAEDVRGRFGSLSLEYAVAKIVRDDAERALLAAWRAELRLAGVPEART